jgi:type IV secretion system protein VirB6
MINIATMVETTIDTQLSTYVTATSSAMTTFLVPIAITGYTIFLVMHAFAIIRGDSQDPISKIVKDFLAAAIIASIALSVGNYQSWVVESANALQSDFSGVLSKGLNAGAPTQSLGATIDKTFSSDNMITLPTGVTIAGQSQVPMDSFFYVLANERANGWGIPDMGLLLSGMILTVAEIIIIACCLLAWLPSKVAFYIWLAMGPAGVLCLLFPITKNYFQQWLSALLGTVFTMCIVTAIVSIIPVMYRGLLTDVLKNIDISSTDVIGRTACMLIASVGLGIVAVNAAQKGAHLAGGGVALDGRGLAAFLINAAMQRGGKGKGDGKDNDKGKGAGGSASEGKGSSDPPEKHASGSAEKHAQNFKKGQASGRAVRNVLSALNRKGDQ